jgi:hypothetical protein
MAEENTPVVSQHLEHTDKLDKLASAIIKVQSVIKPAVKDAESHHGSYADLFAVWDAARKPLHDAGLAVIQAPTTNSATGFMELTTLLIHAASGQYIKSTLSMKPERQGPQAYGSTVTYARRYSLSSLIGMVSMDRSEDDDGNLATTQESETDPGTPVETTTKSNGLTVVTVDEDPFTTKAGKDMVRYTITLSDGRKPTTIFDRVAKEALEAMEYGSLVVVEIKENKKFKSADLISIEPAPTDINDQ